MSKRAEDAAVAINRALDDLESEAANIPDGVARAAVRYSVLVIAKATVLIVDTIAKPEDADVSRWWWRWDR